jgi:hypothetical protein
VPDHLASDILELHYFWADKLLAATLVHTHAANMAVVARVLELPRELRDNVYAQLWRIEKDRDPNRDLLYWWDSFDEPWFERVEETSNLPRLKTPATGLRPPHFVDKAFVGPKFAQEALKRFRGLIGTDLRPVWDRNPVAECGLIDVSMEDFAKKDVFGVGFTVEKLVRNLDLRVNFQCDALTSDDIAELKDDYLTEVGDNVRALISIPYTDRIVTHNENFRYLQTRPRIATLAIRQECGFSDRSDLHSILKLVARAYHGLQEKGFTVKVQNYSKDIGLKVLFEDDVWGWTSEDWTANLERKNTISDYHAEHADIAHNFQGDVWKDIKEYLFQSHGARELELR